MISTELRALVVCPACLTASRGQVESPLGAGAGARELCCARCGERYCASPAGDYLDLRPRIGPVGRVSYYARDAEQFAGALSFRQVGPPYLGAGVRQHWLTRWLAFGPGKLVLDAGCGDGRFAYWNRDRGARIVGIDAAPLFADTVRESTDLVQGDVRLLPFPAATFDAVYSIDVMEHLDAPGIERYFAEIARVLKPAGRLFLFSNTRERSTLWPVIGLWNWIAAVLRARAIGNHEVDVLRKSDHVKVVGTYEELVRLVGRHGLRVERVRFWNGVFQGLIDNVLVRVFEWVLLRPGASHSSRAAVGPQPESGARPSPRQAISRRSGPRAALTFLTGVMQLDLLLFGRLRGGPFFALLAKGPSSNDGPIS